MDPQDIFNLFEGECPECKREVHLVDIGGLPQFLKENTPEHYKGTVNKWDSTFRANDHIDGSMTFKCTEGHQTYVEHTDYGDWQ
jgi:hypothetical protein